MSPHDQYVPLFSRAMEGLVLCLDKADAFLVAHSLPADRVLATSVYPDMFPLATQLHFTVSHPARLAARLGAEGAPLHESPPESLSDAAGRARTMKTWLDALPRSVFDGAANCKIVHRFRSGNEVHFDGLAYVTEWVLPNFFFHETAAYLILRGLGVPVTKKDFMGGHLPA
jgi:hypothetical protein